MLTPLTAVATLVLTRFTTRVITMWEIRRLFFSKLRQIIYFQNTGFEHWLSKYLPFTGLC